MAELTQQASYQIVSPELTVRALRDSGYKSSAYALAEIIDNAIEAGASTVEVFALEVLAQVGSQTRPRVDQIAILDDGSGMDHETLRHSLRFGAGTRRQRLGMGRFGMGLPNSSMSQCCRVDVWSWTNGPDNALRTHLDLSEIEQGATEVPEPVHDPIPGPWRDLSVALSTTGTLVVWSGLDRLQWRRAGKTLEQTEFLIGRFYRRFLSDGRVRIRLAPVRDGEVEASERDARPTDPLYLMAPSTTPAPFDQIPMFEPYGGGSVDLGIEKIPIEVEGIRHEVTIRASMASALARRPDRDDSPWPAEHKTKQPGDTPWGKHARRNVGISLVRADRELDIDTSWANEYNPVERWWGVEVSFPPALDEVFGVTNNKQSATIFTSLARFDWSQEAEAGESFHEFKHRLAAEGDNRLPLIEVAYYIKENVLPKIRRDLDEQTEGTRSAKKRHNEAEAKADVAVKRRRHEGHHGRSDDTDNETTEDEARDEQKQNLTGKHHFTAEDAERMIEETFAQNRSVRLVTSRQPNNPGFFDVESMIGLLQVSLNMDHKVYDQLIAALTTPDNDTMSRDEAIERLSKAETAFKVLLYAWARFEDEQPENGRLKARRMRWDWGQFADEFFSSDVDDDDG